MTEPITLTDERTEWLTALYEANVRMVFKTCRRLLNDPEDAADATHEVFLRAAASLHTAPDGKEARAWLTAVARNYCLDVLRRRRTHQAALTTLGAGAIALESETVVVDRQLAQAVLEQLAVRERRALWESHVEQRSVGEIARRLGLSYLATAQLLHRARRRAAIVAAELAAVLALLRLRVLRQRSLTQTVTHPVAAMVVVQLAAIAVVTSTAGAPHPPRLHAAASPHSQLAPTGPSSPHPNPGLPPSAPPATTPAAAPTTQPAIAVVQQPAPGQAAVAPPPTPAPVVLPSPPPAPSGPPHKWGHLKHHPPGRAVGRRTVP